MHINASYDFPDDYRYIYRVIVWGCNCYTAYFFDGIIMWNKDKIANDCIEHCQVKVV